MKGIIHSTEKIQIPNIEIYNISPLSFILNTILLLANKNFYPIDRVCVSNSQCPQLLYILYMNLTLYT